MSVVAGIVFGFIVWFLMRYLVAGIYTVDQNERAVKTIFGRAERLTDAAIDDPYAEYLRRKNANGTATPRWSSYRPADRTSSGPGSGSTKFRLQPKP